MSEPTLPSLSDLGPDDEMLVHKRCSGFEAAWKRWQDGVRPVLKDWLVDGPVPVRAVLLRELLLLDMNYRCCKAKEQPVLADYLGSFQADEGLLRRVLPEPVSDGGGLSQDSTRAPLTAHGGIDETDERLTPLAAALPPRIGRYRVERVLGQGGFGIVYLAHDDQLQRLVAIKVPHAKLISRPETAESYLSEARTVANLDHPNIVPVHDIGGTDAFPFYVVSKYIDGTNLATKLKESRLSIHETIELVATIAEALHYAHKQGIVHRDIKPGNILLDKNGKPFVADFGLALREQDVGKGPLCAGTPPYMSPEQARGEGNRVDGRSDIFSLGVVLYELLAGRRPFQAKSRDELLNQISTREARPPRQWDDTIPKELERICLKALSKPASERYTTAKDVADELRHFLASASVEEKDQAGCKPIGESAVHTPASDQRPIPIVPKLSAVMPGTQANRTRREPSSPEEVIRLTAAPQESLASSPQVQVLRVPTRPLRRRLIAAALLAGALGTLALVVLLNRDRNPGNNSPVNQGQAAAALRQLDEFPPHRYFHLLDKPPLSSAEEPDPRQWRWDKDEETLEIKAPENFLFFLGETTRARFRLEAGIAQAPWTGNVGAFWGYHEDASLKRARTPDKAFAWFQMVLICQEARDVGVSEFSVQRAKCQLIYNGVGDLLVSAHFCCKHAIPYPAPGEKSLLIDIGPDRLNEALLGSVRLTQLSDKAANEVFAKTRSRGSLGLITRKHAVVFGNVRFTAQSNN